MKQRVRDAGVAGSNPATPTKTLLGFLLFCPSAFKVNHRFNHRNPMLGRYGFGGAVQEVRVMVAIRRQQHLGRHTEKACCLPDRYAALHHPGDSVSIGWTDQAGQAHSATIVLANGPAA